MAQRFSEFYEGWISKLEKLFYEELLPEKEKEKGKSEQEVQAVVAKVTVHLKEYYTFKWAAARDDVPVFFSPSWLTPLENAFLWMTGWRPSVVLKLLENLKKQEALMLNEEQNRKTHDLRVRISMEEERVEAEMERLQMALAGRKMVELAKLSSNGDGDAAAVDMALKGVLAGLERVMKAADCVRLKTLKGILDVLTPMQCVDFLAANIAMQLRLREWGMKDMNVNQDNN